MNTIRMILKRIGKDSRGGSDTIEAIALIVLIAVGCIVAFQSIGKHLKEVAGKADTEVAKIVAP